MLELSIRVIDGDSGAISLTATETIAQIQRQIADQFRVPETEGVTYRILHKGKLLDPSGTLRAEGVQDGDKLTFGSIQQYRQFQDDAHIHIKGLPR